LVYQDAFISRTKEAVAKSVVVGRGLKRKVGYYDGEEEPEKDIQMES
jgi:hypothetical protein